MFITKKKYEEMENQIFELRVRLGALSKGIIQESLIKDPKLKEIGLNNVVRTAKEYREYLHHHKD